MKWISSAEQSRAIPDWFFERYYHGVSVVRSFHGPVLCYLKLNLNIDSVSVLVLMQVFVGWSARVISWIDFLRDTSLISDHRILPGEDDFQIRMQRECCLEYRSIHKLSRYRLL